MEGYHSPQVDVDGAAQHQRVARAAARRRGATRSPPSCRRVDWHRYPDRAATELRAAHRRAARRRAPSRCSRPTARTRCCRRCCLTYGGPGRTVADVRADLPLHGHIARLTGTDGGRGRARPTTSRSTSPRCDRVLADAAAGRSRSCARPTTRPGWSSPRRRCVERARRWRPGCVVVDEAYGQFAPWSALDLVDEDVPLVVTRTYSKTWSMAAARLGYLVGPSWLVGRAREGGAAVPPRRAPSRSPAAWPCGFVDEMEARVKPVVAERERLAAALADAAASTSWPSGANFVLFRPARPRRPTTCGRRCSTAACSSATARRGPASTAACGSPSARRPRTTRFLAALAEVLAR